MYRKDTDECRKHADFILLDMICLQAAYVLAYAASGLGFHPYTVLIYRNLAVFLELVNLVVIFTCGTMKNVLKTGYRRDFVVALCHSALIGASAALYLAFLRQTQEFSHRMLILTPVIYLAVAYPVRELWKKRLQRQMKTGGKQRLLILASGDAAEQVVRNMQENNYGRYSLAGVSVIDADWTGREICGLPVVATGESAPTYVCREWIDEVLVVVSEDLPYPTELIDRLTETGVTVHVSLAEPKNAPGKKQFPEKIGNYAVLTTSMNCATSGQLLWKRLMDIAGGIVGCILTGIICLFVGPAIYIASPGPIFYTQQRVGRNGKPFKMYKFRSMYMDADARKAELMRNNRYQDGKMFKLDFDPRVIGNQVLPDGTRKTGVGDFIRRTSLDEFPQFFNVLKGDMSLIGTRPPLPSETALYELHHRKRLAIKPGITGMWQISGRSGITDFEEVVNFDREYIENWSIGLDIKIILRTVSVVFGKVGSL